MSGAAGGVAGRSGDQGRQRCRNTNWQEMASDLSLEQQMEALVREAEMDFARRVRSSIAEAARVPCTLVAVDSSVRVATDLWTIDEARTIRGTIAAQLARALRTPTRLLYDSALLEPLS